VSLRLGNAGDMHLESACESWRYMVSCDELWVAQTTLPIFEVYGCSPRLEFELGVVQNCFPVADAVLWSDVRAGSASINASDMTRTALQPATSMLVSSSDHFLRMRFEGVSRKSGAGGMPDVDCARWGNSSPFPDACGSPISSRNAHAENAFNAGEAGSEPRRCLGGLLRSGGSITRGDERRSERYAAVRTRPARQMAPRANAHSESHNVQVVHYGRKNCILVHSEGSPH